MVVRDELGIVLGGCGVDYGVYCSQAGFQAQVRRGEAEVWVEGHNLRILQVGVGF